MAFDHLPGWIYLSPKATANIGCSALIPALVFTAFALIVVLLRWYSRAYFSKTVGAEDFLVTAALVLSIAITGIVVAEFKLDMNVPKPSRASLLEMMMKLVYIQSIFYHLAIALVKTSILIQYRRLFLHISPCTVWVCNALLTLVAVVAGWGTGGVVFFCQPVRKYWNVDIPGSCMDAETHFFSTAILGMALDIAIWVCPMPVVGMLKLPARQKLGLCAVGLLGGFVCIVSILRLAIVHGAAKNGDVTKSGTHALIYSTLELNIAIICASLLVMKPLIQRFIPKLLFDIRPPRAAEDGSYFRRCLAILQLTEAKLESSEGEGLYESNKWADRESGADCGSRFAQQSEDR